MDKKGTILVPVKGFDDFEIEVTIFYDSETHEDSISGSFWGEQVSSYTTITDFYSDWTFITDISNLNAPRLLHVIKMVDAYVH